MNTNEKGAIGLIEVIRDLTKKGYECFTPLHDYSAVDLIVLDRNHVPVKLQIKYREFKDDIIDIGFSTVVNGKKVPIDLSAIDGWAIYIPDVDAVCYIPKSDIPPGAKGTRIRKTPGSKTINIDKKAIIVYKQLLNEEKIWKGG